MIIPIVAVILSAALAGAVEPEAVAKVNGVVITKSEFERQLGPYLQRRGLPAGHNEKTDKTGKVFELKQQLLESLVGYELLYQEAKKRKFSADTATVDAEIEKTRSQFPAPELFEKAMAQQGLTLATYKEYLGRALAIQKLVDAEYVKDVTVTDAEIHDAYTANLERFKTPEQVRARHILVKVDEKADEKTRQEARKKIEEMAGQIKGGKDFAEVATAQSECPSKSQGGDLGFFNRDDMVKPFSDAAFGMKPGEVSGVVETKFGYHLIKVEERRDASVVPEKEVSEEIRESLKQGKLSKFVFGKVEEMRKKAKVEILLKPE
jgi:peptidyl-prolyl cis-trans isomerase C